MRGAGLLICGLAAFVSILVSTPVSAVEYPLVVRNLIKEGVEFSTHEDTRTGDISICEGTNKATGGCGGTWKCTNGNCSCSSGSCTPPPAITVPQQTSKQLAPAPSGVKTATGSSGGPGAGAGKPPGGTPSGGLGAGKPPGDTPSGGLGAGKPPDGTPSGGLSAGKSPVDARGLCSKNPNCRIVRDDAQITAFCVGNNCVAARKAGKGQQEYLNVTMSDVLVGRIGGTPIKTSQEIVAILVGQVAPPSSAGSQTPSTQKVKGPVGPPAGLLEDRSPGVASPAASPGSARSKALREDVLPSTGSPGGPTVK
jgi:DNA polymerase III subunit gamma/tau